MSPGLKRVLYSVAAAGIIVCNVLMATVVRPPGDDAITPIFVIVITLFAWYFAVVAARNRSRPFHDKRMSFWWSLAFYFLLPFSVIRLINRLDPMPSVVMGSTVIVAIGAGTLVLFFSIGQIARRTRRSWGPSRDTDPGAK
jgi:predicted permease